MSEQAPEHTPEQAPETKPRGTKPILIAAVAVLAGAGLIASVQPWVHLEFIVGAAAIEGLSLTGQKLKPALTLIALASVAAALVLMIAGKMFRRIIGLLIVLLGAGFATLAIAAISDPLIGASAQIGEATGISGDAQAALVGVLEVTFWPTATLIVGALLAATGVFVTLLSGKWKTAGRKYDTGTSSDAPRAKRTPEPQGDRISDWDALSDGDDPTD